MNKQSVGYCFTFIIDCGDSGYTFPQWEPGWFILFRFTKGTKVLNMIQKFSIFTSYCTFKCSVVKTLIYISVVDCGRDLKRGRPKPKLPVICKLAVLYIASCNLWLWAKSKFWISLCGNPNAVIFTLC